MTNELEPTPDPRERRQAPTFPEALAAYRKLLLEADRVLDGSSELDVTEIARLDKSIEAAKRMAKASARIYVIDNLANLDPNAATAEYILEHDMLPEVPPDDEAQDATVDLTKLD